MVVTEPRIKTSKGSGQMLVGLTPEGLLLRGDYSPRTSLSAEIAYKKNEKQKVTLEISEKFITVWTKMLVSKNGNGMGSRVFIFRRVDQSIWFGEGNTDEVRVDGNTYAKSEKGYQDVSQEMSKFLADLFYSYPENEMILPIINELAGNPTDSVQRFLKLLLQFLD